MANIEVYSDLSDEAALDIEGRRIKDLSLRELHLKMVPLLTVMKVAHWSYKNPESDEMVLRQGQLVAHEGMRGRFSDFFKGLLDLRFPVAHAVPMAVSKYKWNDELSMADNNTTAYRPDLIYRPEGSPVASEHLRGSALDLNPLDNPIINPDHSIEPIHARGRRPDLGMHIRRHPAVITLARSLDMEWGGDWADPRFPDFYGTDEAGNPKHILTDQHHFELVPRLVGALTVPTGIWSD